MKKPLRLLIIEDSPVDAELLCAELKRGGYEVLAERVDTDTALRAALANGSWDLIVSDFAMPNYDGLRAFETFKSFDLDIPYIIVSGAMGEERAVETMKTGVCDYLLKGHLGRLNVAVERELEAAKQRRLGRENDLAKARDQRRMAVALQATGAGIFEYRVPADGQGYCSPRFAEILAYDVADLPTDELFAGWLIEQTHRDDRAQFEASYSDFIAGRTPQMDCHFRIRRKDGSWRSVSCLEVAGARDAGGYVTELVGVLLDRTEKVRLEEQFRQAQKMEAIGRLAGGVAHDFNNLLTVISNFGEFVRDALDPASETHADMQEVLKAADRAAQLTNQLLAFSRRQAIDPTVLNANALVGDLDKMLRRLIGGDIEFQTKFAPDLWNVFADRGGLEQVIVNLVVNARDAMPHGGRLTIETSNHEVDRPYSGAAGREIAPGQYAVISVTDNGTGMDEATLEKIFEPFFTTKAANKGTGLGLSTCFGIAEQAGGHIEVCSELALGSTFRVYVPREASRPLDSADDTTSEKLRGDETVLVVEDEEAVRTLLSRILTMLGYSVRSANNGEDALRLINDESLQVDLLVTDIVMPKMGGPELVSLVSKKIPGTKVLYITGFSQGALDDDSTSVILHKPFSPKSLAKKVREVMDA